jgi:3'(2'), 5'-bisphosphate nucleotidase
MSLSPLLLSAIDIAKEAAALILSIYQNGQFEQKNKSDNTPVTTADLAAHDYINRQLQATFPDIPVLSEEAATIPLSERKAWSRYWLIDPLDGTQEFIAGSGEFATVIALVEDNRPVIGVVCSPITGVVYYAEKGKGAWMQAPEQAAVAIYSRHHDSEIKGLDIAISRRQNTQVVRCYLSDTLEYDFVPFGSASLKACLVAEGKADCYLRIGPTGEWDTGATQCIVEEAGGQLLNLSLKALSYNQRDTLENPNFIVLGDRALPWERILQA